MSNLKTLRPFKPGNDPRRNTKGRPTSTYSRAKFQEILNNELEKKVPGTETTNLEFIIQRMIIDALKGKIGACKLIMDYHFGKPGKEKRLSNVIDNKPVIEITDALKKHINQLKK